MNKTLEISAMQYDFHTLLKVSDICGLTGEIGFHDTDTGYLVSFPDDDGKAVHNQNRIHSTIPLYNPYCTTECYISVNF